MDNPSVLYLTRDRDVVSGKKEVIKID